jgi:hypothetical protein
MNESRKNTSKQSRLLSLVLACSLLVGCSGWALASESDLTVLDNGVVQERTTGRMWHMERSKKIRSAAEVQQYLAELNQGPFTDWRLPNKWELYNLYKIFDLKKNGQVQLQLNGSYWLVDNRGTMRPGEWEIGDQCGPERLFYSAKSGYVRAIRP